MKKVTVLGYGNELRGDQVAGRVVAEAIASRRMPGVRVATTRMLTRGHIPLIADADMVIFVGTYDADKVEPVRVARVRLGKTASGYVKDPASLMEMVSQRQGHAPEAWSVMVPATHRGLQAPPSPQAEEAIDEAIMHVLDLMPLSALRAGDSEEIEQSAQRARGPSMARWLSSVPTAYQWVKRHLHDAHAHHL